MSEHCGKWNLYRTIPKNLSIETIIDDEIRPAVPAAKANGNPGQIWRQKNQLSVIAHWQIHPLATARPPPLEADNIITSTRKHNPSGPLPPDPAVIAIRIITSPANIDRERTATAAIGDIQPAHHSILLSKSGKKQQTEK